MKAFIEVFCMELRALWRSRSFLLLLVASLAYVSFVPSLVHGDGTLLGTRELTIAYSLGGVFAIVVLALVSSATASLAKEREAKRLQLTAIRPIRYSLIVLGKLSALVFTGALTLALSMALMSLRVDTNVNCRRVLRPVLPSVQEEAEAMYQSYLSDPETPPEVKKSPKSTVLRILEGRALDHYQTIPTNSPVTWRFQIPIQSTNSQSDNRLIGQSVNSYIRLRFTNPMEMRQEVRGCFRSAGHTLTLTNMTQTVLEVPFPAVDGELEFTNLGISALMLRPRRDVELLLPAGSFYGNLFRAWALQIAVLTLILAFTLFLASALGRPVALFTAISMLILGLISPSVVEQYPDELHATFADRVGLAMSRAASAVTRPISAYSPVTSLSKDELIESSDLTGAIAIDFIAVPLILILLSSLILPRKQDGL